MAKRATKRSRAFAVGIPWSAIASTTGPLTAYFLMMYFWMKKAAVQKLHWAAKVFSQVQLATLKRQTASTGQHTEVKNKAEVPLAKGLRRAGKARRRWLTAGGAPTAAAELEAALGKHCLDLVRAARFTIQPAADEQAKLQQPGPTKTDMHAKKIVRVEQVRAYPFSCTNGLTLVQSSTPMQRWSWKTAGAAT